MLLPLLRTPQAGPLYDVAEDQADGMRFESAEFQKLAN